MKSELICGDSLEEMPKLIARGIKFDAIIADPPYGTTVCKWDSIVPFNRYIMIQKSSRSKNLVAIYRDDYILQEIKKGRDYHEICDDFDANAKDGMWQYFNQLIKPNGAIVLFGSEPFSTKLRNSNLDNYKYDWVWEKSKPTGHLNAKIQPLRKIENIIVFYKKQCLYNPQGIKPTDKIVSRTNRGNYGECSKTTRQTITNYPKNVLSYPSIDGVHQTQKPVGLMEYLVKTYTNEGETVFDPFAGSGTTGKACKNLNRNFVLIEKDKGIFNTAKQRIGSDN